MKQEYIITNEELAVMGLDLNDYALNGSCINAIITIALKLALTQIKKLDDDIKSNAEIELALDNDSDKVDCFKDLQFRIIYNLIFMGDNGALDQIVNNIIVYDLGWGKINGFQKGIYRR